jgi:hypothetical protein
MALLTQDPTYPMFYEGWYGSCLGQACESFQLVSGTGASSQHIYNNIQSVFLVSENKQGTVAYNGLATNPSLIDIMPIKALFCGKAYRIILKPGTGSIDIPQFNFSNAGTLDTHRLINKIEAGCPEYTGVLLWNTDVNKFTYATTEGYSISAIIGGYPENILEFGTPNDKLLFVNQLVAMDYWSAALSGTPVSTPILDVDYFSGDEWLQTPSSMALQPINGLVLSLSSYNDPNDGTLGYANTVFQRVFSTEAGDPYDDLGESWGLIPEQSYLVLNKYYMADGLNPTPKGKTENFYVVLHEIGHCLGLGTLWHWHYNLEGYDFCLRSFIVGAGDTAPNPLTLGLSANFFYSTRNINLQRTELQPGGFTTYGGQTYNVGDARYTNAFNTYGKSGDFVSSAVTAYNEAFGLSLTAIPVENGGGFGSLGSHWEEGYVGGAFGPDNRLYYGTPAPGLNDELMSPQSEGRGIDLPTSKITLGALEDLGYTVNYNMADSYNPLEYSVIYSGDSAKALTVVPYTSAGGIGYLGYNFDGQTGSSEGSKYIPVKRGLTYNFTVYSTSGNVTLTEDSAGTTPVTVGVTNNGISSGTIRYNVPTNLAQFTWYWLHAGNLARVLVYVQ